MKLSFKKLGSISVVTLLVLSGCGGSSSDTPVVNAETKSVTDSQKSAILVTYADVALANYTDTVNDAKALQIALSTFTENPTQTTLQVAKDAWKVSRESYLQSEVFRLSDGPIDAESGWVATAYNAPEGQLNAWPLDENMIDYTISKEGTKTSGNIIDTIGQFTPSGGTQVDITTITAEALSSLNENGGAANVATGYHAIEFLLWGQDQDYTSFVADTITNGPLTAGERPVSDYISEANSDRRKAYLNAAASKIVIDLELVASAWSKTLNGNTGRYRAALLNELTGENASDNIATDISLKAILSGMGVFIKSEVANERIAVAVLTPSEEDEHSCFSDNTHRDIAGDFEGFKNILNGTYKGAHFGPGIMANVSASQITITLALTTSIDSKISSIDTKAKTVEHFDYQILEGHNATEITALKNEMRALGDEMVNVAKELGITLSTSSVTDSGETKL
jgi:putative iron-regulated protein